MPKQPQSAFANSFLESAQHAVALKDAKAQFEILFKSLKDSHPFSARNWDEAQNGQTQFEICHEHIKGRPYTVGNLTLSHQNPEIIEAKIYDGQYGWQAEPTVIPLDVNDPAHKAGMDQFTKNIAYGVEVESHIDALLLRIAEHGPIDAMA